MSEKAMVTIDCDLIIPEEEEKVFEDNCIELSGKIECRGKLTFKNCEIEVTTPENGNVGIDIFNGTLEMDECKVTRPGRDFVGVFNGKANIRSTSFWLESVASFGSIINGFGCEIRCEDCSFEENNLGIKETSDTYVPYLVEINPDCSVSMLHCSFKNLYGVGWAESTNNCSFLNCKNISHRNITASKFVDCEVSSDGQIDNSVFDYSYVKSAKIISSTFRNNSAIEATYSGDSGCGYVRDCNFTQIISFVANRIDIADCKFQKLRNDDQCNVIVRCKMCNLLNLSFDDLQLTNNSYLLADYGDVTGNVEEWKFTNCSTDVADGAVSIDGSVLEDRIRERDKSSEDEEESAPMGLLKGALKLLGSAALGATGIAATFLRTAGEASGNGSIVNIAGAVQDKSFETIRDMWTPDEKKDEDYYEAQAERSERRAVYAEQRGSQLRKQYEKEKAKYESDD